MIFATAIYKAIVRALKLNTCLSVCLCVCLSIYLFICLSVCLYVCLTMNVVTRHMTTMTEKVFVLRIPALTPKFSTINSTNPLVFIRAAMTLLSLVLIPEQYAADPAPIYWNHRQFMKLKKEVK